MNFGLYGSNWTEMDLKFKKTLLMAMIMNSSHKRVMKVSPNSIVNLEMFTGVIKLNIYFRRIAHGLYLYLGSRYYHSSIPPSLALGTIIANR